MATITVRVDDEAERALAELTSEGRSQSAVIREAIIAAWVTRRRARLRAEAEALASDPDDVAEMRAVQADLESLRAW
jgi:predicted transcriptional regulator